MPSWPCCKWEGSNSVVKSTATLKNRATTFICPTEQWSCGASRANHKSVGRLTKVISGSGLKVRDTGSLFYFFFFSSSHWTRYVCAFLRPKRRSCCRSTRSWRTRTWRLQSTTSGKSTTRSWFRKLKKRPKPRPPKTKTAPQWRRRRLLLHRLLCLLLLRPRRRRQKRRLPLQRRKAPTGWTSAKGSSWWTPSCPASSWTPRRPPRARTAARCWNSPSDRCRIQ